MKNDKCQDIEKITIVGGTHGNEFLGPYFIRKAEQARIYQDNAIEVSTLLANPEAFALGQRFIHQDLNRSFTPDVLVGTQNQHEYQRAREISRYFSRENLDKHFIIDLHSSTSNIGVTLLVPNDDPVNIHAAAYVQQNIPEVRILFSDIDRANSRSLNSLSRFGITIATGPLANAVIRHDQFDTTERVVDLVVKFLTLCKTREEPKLPDNITAFKVRERVHYPRDNEGELMAMVHKELQDRDYRLMEAGHPVFMSFQGDEIRYDGEPGYPVFINEAAYYHENTAFIIHDKIKVPLKPSKII